MSWLTLMLDRAFNPSSWWIDHPFNPYGLTNPSYRGVECLIYGLFFVWNIDSTLRLHYALWLWAVRAISTWIWRTISHIESLFCFVWRWARYEYSVCVLVNVTSYYFRLILKSIRHWYLQFPYRTFPHSSNLLQ